MGEPSDGRHWRIPAVRCAGGDTTKWSAAWDNGMSQGYYPPST